MENIHFKNNTFHFFPLSSSKIQIIIIDLKDKPCSISDISTKVEIKICLHTSKQYTVLHIQFEYGVYPDILKEAWVVPIYKTNNKRDVGNYRSISILSKINKILEKAIHQKMNSFIVSNGIISNYQYGFKKNSSIDLDVFIFLISIMKSQYVFFLDLRKTFYSMNHQILLEKNYKLRFIGNI